MGKITTLQSKAERGWQLPALGAVVGAAVFLALAGCGDRSGNKADSDPAATTYATLGQASTVKTEVPSQTTAYLPTWLNEEVRQGSYADLLGLPDDTYDTVIVSFAVPNAEGGLDKPEISQQATEVVDKIAKKKGLGVGGYGKDEAEHKKLKAHWARVLDAPERMVQDIVNAVNEGGYETVDIDFEYPAAEQKNQFTAFMFALRSALPTDTVITLAIPAFDGSRAGYDFKALNRLIGNGGYHLMSYDYSGSWTPKAGDVANAEDVLNNLATVIDEIGDSKKISLGFNSICRVFKGATSKGSYHAGRTEDIGYSELIKAGVKVIDDPNLGSSYAKINKSWTSCTSPNVVRAVIDQALNQGGQLGGFFVWHAGGANAEFASALKPGDD